MSQLYRPTVSSQNKIVKPAGHSKENRKGWNSTTKTNVSGVNRSLSSSTSKRSILTYRSNNPKMKTSKENLDKKEQNERCPKSKEKSKCEKDKTKAEIHKEILESISRESCVEEELLLPLEPIEASNNNCLIGEIKGKGGLKKLKAKIIGTPETGCGNILHSLVLHSKYLPISLNQNSEERKHIGKTSFEMHEEKFQF